MEIRKLNAQDAKMYRTLRLEALRNHPDAFGSSYEEELEYPLSLFEERFRNGPAVTLGAFIDGGLAGTVTLFPETKKKFMHRVNLVAMYVDPKQRRSGAGKKLVSAALDLAREMEGVTHVYLAVTSTNIPAKKLYESMGFVTYGVDKSALNLDGTLYSEDLMVLVL
ncbi:GNAT family N-acetyltransferase [Neobacillus piezotolerans]|uniref:GNAT family N-acetyltransferase n=1 Tax=Neobacillus piezotolerans TaxID=2259171 RepID=A0A3D8GWM6_9BACI|nr:GNAT family N-acetyltransferase [Neobacillus piezotolerans]RDU38860.1 GNAT family N-acetyltransferase [Neobacillus piezotolerans]